jgi:acyl carrier protein
MTKNTDQQQIMPESMEPRRRRSGGDPLDYFNQCQSALGQFISMQQEQQKTAQYFINIQEKMLDAAFNGFHIKPSAHPWKNLDCAAEAPLDHTSRAPVFIPLGAPPAPDIPTSVFEPIDEAPPRLTPGTEPARRDNPPVPGPASGVDKMPSFNKSGASPALPSNDEFKNNLLLIASERTGFDPEMLSLEANMETDLGIDSIKKTEILSSLREKYEIMNQLDEDQLIEELADLMTLGSIIAWFDNKRKLLTENAVEMAIAPQQPLSYSESRA